MKMKKIMSGVMAATIAATAFTALAAGSGRIPEGTAVSLREMPDIESAQIGGVEGGTEVELIEKASSTMGNTWYLVRVGDTEGYVYSKYIDVIEDVEAPAEQAVGIAAMNPESDDYTSGEREGRIKAEGNVNVRAAAGTEAARVTIVSNGSAVTVIDKTVSGTGAPWYKIRVHGMEGFISAQYVTFEPAEAETQETTAETAPAAEIEREGKIKANGKVNVRAEASSNAKLILSVKNDTPLTVLEETRSAAGGTWYKVRIEGKEGYINGKFVVITEAGAEPEPEILDASESAAPEAAEETETLIDRPGRIISNKSKVNVRAKASVKSKQLKMVENGTELTVLSAEKNSDGEVWYKVRIGKTEGYVLDQYVEVAEAAEEAPAEIEVQPSETPEAEQTETVEAPEAIETIDESEPAEEPEAAEENAERAAWIVSEGNVNVRESAGTESERVTIASNGTQVVVLDRAKSDTGAIWYKIRIGDKEGYISGKYIVFEEPTEEPAAEAQPQEEAQPQAEAPAKAEPAEAVSSGALIGVPTAKLNVRAEMDAKAKVVGQLKPTDKVEVIGEREVGPVIWYQIRRGELEGFVSGQYLAVQDAPNANLIATGGIAIEKDNKSEEYSEKRFEVAGDLSELMNSSVTLSFDLNTPGTRGSSVSDATNYLADRFGCCLTVFWSDSTGEHEAMAEYPRADMLKLTVNDKRVYATYELKAPEGYDTMDQLGVALETGARPASDNNAVWSIGKIKLEAGANATPWVANAADFEAETEA